MAVKAEILCAAYEKIFYVNLIGGEKMPKLYVSPEVPEEKLSLATIALLTKLFSDMEYSAEEKLFFECLFKNGIENFISGEIFTCHMIKLDFEGTQTETEKFFYQMSLAYLLHQRHNAKLNRGTPPNFRMETFDLYLYDILCNFAHDNHRHWQMRDRECFSDGDNRGINFFKKLQETSFRFIPPLSTGIQYVWNGNQYRAENYNRLNIAVCGYDNEFSKYVKTLLAMKYNALGIHKNRFGYTKFLEEVTGIRRSHKLEYSLPYCRTPKVDLLIFCVALGYSRQCFDRILQLREQGRAAGVNPAIPDNPFAEDSIEMKILTAYLNNHSEKVFEYFKRVASSKSADKINLVEVARKAWRYAVEYVNRVKKQRTGELKRNIIR